MANYRRVFEEGYSYFITIVTHRREPILVEHIELLRESFARSKKRYDYSIDAIVVLPDHLHMIITPRNVHDYPKVISHIKRSFTYGINEALKQKAKLNLSSSSCRRKLSGIWQKRYYHRTK